MAYKKRLVLPLNRDSKKANLPGRLLWRFAWVLQFLLWGFLLLFLAYHWLVETPTMKGYYAAGLEPGFDALAGVVASLDPTFSDLEEINGRSGANRFTSLTGESFFTVWREQDEMPTWNAGLARLRFSREGQLLWVRRYNVPEQNPEFAVEKTSGIRFPVIYSWSARENARSGHSAAPAASTVRPPAAATPAGGRP